MAHTLRPNAVLIDLSDNVVTLTCEVGPGAGVVFLQGEACVEVSARGEIPFGHKIAKDPIEAGEIVRKYGEPIGAATSPIMPGEHVHTHNVRSLRAQVELIEEAQG